MSFKKSYEPIKSSQYLATQKYCQNIYNKGKIYSYFLDTVEQYRILTKNCTKLCGGLNQNLILFAGSLEAAYSLNWGAREIWGKGGGETLALL